MFLSSSLTLLHHDWKAREAVEVHVQRPGPGHLPDQLHDPALLPLNTTDPLQPA